MLKVSIITVCYNSAETIENTIQSVLEQDYKNIEYIIIDGKSSDTTLQIIDKYSSRISKVISEKDDGIYFAINKGIATATGDIIGILHADDFYTNEQIISKVVNKFQEKHVDTVYGNLQYVDRIDISKIKRNWISGDYKEGLFLKGWMPPHPTFFVQKNCYEKYGVFNTSLRSASDYELMLRLLHKNKCSTVYIPEVLVKMRVGGKSNVSLLNRIKANREDKKAWLLNDLKPGIFTLFLKPLSKLRQFF
ncbi:MAG: glycosyl transferase [Bacteroidetes bacterium RIFCSPLOWO2_12_FULL_35_15]|nr:MAG: glycosyl transferase [Bacteroidetes bacterium RIFCSPLOWO2_12_FULL_35_15]